MEFLEYKVYRNENELVAAFSREEYAKVFIESAKLWDEWKIVKNGEIIYNTVDEE